MTVTALVFDEQGRAALAGLEMVEPVVYEPGAAWPEQAAAAEVLVVPPRAQLADQLLAAMRDLPKLRMVQTLSAGTELWDGKLPDGVLLSNARGANGGATAELAVAGLLALYREVPQFVADQAAHRWNQHLTETLDGKRVLVLGAGDLGQNLRAMLEPFGATVTLVGRSARIGVCIAVTLVALAALGALGAWLGNASQWRGCRSASTIGSARMSRLRR